MAFGPCGFESRPGYFFNRRWTTLIATDVGYNDNGTALAAAVAFEKWSSPTAAGTYTTLISKVEEYEPGKFYRRELPCLMELLDRIDVPVNAVVVDGHVWLSEGKPGLGHYLFEALGGRTPIIGVAKRPFHNGIADPVLRGVSKNPLHVTSVGTDQQSALDGVAAMHGPHRIPTLLKQVDGLSRGR